MWEWQHLKSCYNLLYQGSLDVTSDATILTSEKRNFYVDPEESPEQLGDYYNSNTFILFSISTVSDSTN